MTFWDRFYKLCRQNGKYPNNVCQELGFSNATATKWKKGSIPSSETLQKIASYFGVTTDYLSGIPSNAEPAYKSARTPVNFWGKVSAGIGAYAGGVPLREMAADDEDMLDGYDYAWLEVEGDSMVNDLHDGDYVLVRVQDTAESGDLVVATITDDCETKGFVKWYEHEDSHVALISSNPKYPPRIFVGEAMNSVRIFGVVVTSKRRWK